MSISVAELESAGLGLGHGWVELVDVPAAWLKLGERVATDVATDLGPLAAGVQHIGSTSVLGLLAKPVLDLAIGTHPDVALDLVSSRLVAHGWTYRGDAGDNGGHVFVLEGRPMNRVAHAHVVGFDGPQWVSYLIVRDVLRASASARQRYADDKRRLVATLGRDNSAGAYTDGKSGVVADILSGRYGGIER